MAPDPRSEMWELCSAFVLGKPVIVFYGGTVAHCFSGLPALWGGRCYPLLDRPTWTPATLLTAHFQALCLGALLTGKGG